MAPSTTPEEKVRKTDRHKFKRVARISDQDFDDLNQLAAQHDRPWTWELKRAIRAHLQAHGIVHGDHHAESE